MPTKKAVTNEQIMDVLMEFMNMTSDNFERLTRGQDELSNRMEHLERQYAELKQRVEYIAGEQKAQANDIKEVLDRILTLEKRLPQISEADLRNMQTELQAIIDWAQKVAKTENISLKLR